MDRDGQPIRRFDVEHERRMHTIVVRRDLTGFQHLHPEMAANGTWSTPLRLDEAGAYRVYADFSHLGEARTLATDLRVDGDADPRPLPAPSATATSDGGDAVRLDAGALHAGRETTLELTVARDGRPVELEPYLGAGRYRLFLQNRVGAQVRTVAFTLEVTA